MVYVFGDYTLDTCAHELRRAGERLMLQPRVFHVLSYLVQQRHRLVTKQELLKQLWSGQFVDDSAVARCIMAARKALGDSSRAPRYIETLHGYGYRFAAVVTEQVSAPSGAEPPLSTRVHLAGTDVLPCVTCQSENGVDARFCAACGTRLPEISPRCAQMLHLPAAFCTACGQRLGGGSPSELTSVPTMPPFVAPTTPPRSAWIVSEAECKQATVLCCTLANIQPLAANQGIERLHHLIHALYALALAEMQRSKGTSTSPAMVSPWCLVCR
jgi:DNA-binding winged helix-turn-helix (wHTH) protein